MQMMRFTHGYKDSAERIDIDYSGWVMMLIQTRHDKKFAAAQRFEFFYDPAVYSSDFKDLKSSENCFR